MTLVLRLIMIMNDCFSFDFSIAYCSDEFFRISGFMWVNRC